MEEERTSSFAASDALQEKASKASLDLLKEQVDGERSASSSRLEDLVSMLKEDIKESEAAQVCLKPSTAAPPYRVFSGHCTYPFQ